MPDLDDLLSPEIVTAAGDAARRPSLRALTTRGARRRRARQGSVLVGAAVAVTAIAVGAAQLRSSPDRTPSPAPEPSSPTSPASSNPSDSGHSGVAQATAVVRAHDSRIAALATAPGSPQHRISEWYTCGGDSTCNDGRYALTVSADGFRHSTIVDLPVTKGFYGVEPAGTSHFVVSVGDRLVGVVDLTGTVQRITVDGPPGPAAYGEAVSTLTRRPLALDPVTGAAHPLLLPTGSRYVDDVSGRLWTSGRGSRIAWSDDGGAQWHQLALPSGAARKVLLPIASGDAGVQGLIRGTYAVGANFTWNATLRSTDDGAFASEPPSAGVGSTVAANGSVILADGRLLVLVTYWSSWQNGRHGPRAGFYTGPDWSHLDPVPMGAPFAGLPYTAAPVVLSLTAAGGAVTIYATPPSQSEVFSSPDGGVTWHPERAR